MGQQNRTVGNNWSNLTNQWC